jgi:O-antigen ligase
MTATASGAAPALRRLTHHERLRTVMRALGLLAFEAMIGAGVASSHVKYVIILVAGVIVCWSLWRFPLPGAIVGLFLATGIIDPLYFVFRFAGRTVYGYEVVLLILFLRAALRPRRSTWGGMAGGALAVFLFLLVVSTLFAVSSGATALNNAVNWGRSFDALLTFWVVIRLFPDRRSLGILLTAGLVIGAMSGILGAFLALTHNTSQLFIDPGNNVATPGTSLMRVRMPGLGMGFMLLGVGLVWIARSRRPLSLWWVCVLCILIDILVSQNRNMWLSGAFAFVLVLLVAGPRVRGRLLIGLALIVAAIALLIAVPQGNSVGTTPLQPIISRASTLLNPGKLAGSSSLSDRAYEDRHALPDAEHHLLIGIGPGVPYGAALNTGTSQDPFATTARLFVQNQYLYILLITGAPGAAAFLLFLFATLGNAFKRGVPVESRVLGVAVIALMLTAIVMLSFTSESYLVPLGLVSGVIFALRPSPDPSIAPAEGALESR